MILVTYLWFDAGSTSWDPVIMKAVKDNSIHDLPLAMAILQIFTKIQEFIESMSQMAAHSRKLSDSEKVSREKREIQKSLIKAKQDNGHINSVAIWQPSSTSKTLEWHIHSSQSDPETSHRKHSVQTWLEPYFASKETLKIYQGYQSIIHWNPTCTKCQC